MTTVLQSITALKYYTLAGFEPSVFYSEGGRDGHYATQLFHFVPQQHLFHFVLTFGRKTAIF
jgi:hypothetical protein